MSIPELSELLVPDAAAWREWLQSNHETSPGVHVVLHKSEGDVTTLTYDAAVEEALCFGWIDGLASRRDEGSWRVRMTPRRSRSNWSERNVRRVEQLERDGRMHESGRAAVDSAKADGRWPGADSCSVGSFSSHLADSDAGDDQDYGDEETDAHGAVDQLRVTFAGAIDEGVEDTQGGQSEDGMEPALEKGEPPSRTGEPEQIPRPTWMSTATAVSR